MFTQPTWETLMRSWMIGGLIIALLWGSGLEAARRRRMSTPSCYGVYGEVVYLRPSVCDLNFVVSDPRSPADISDSVPLGRESGVDPDHDFGYRLWAEYTLGRSCQGGRVGYTQLHTRDASVVHPVGTGGLWPILAQPPSPVLSSHDQTEAESKGVVDFTYYASDAIYTLNLRPVPSLVTTLIAGVHYARIDQKLKARYEGFFTNESSETVRADIRVKRERKVWGSGPEMGADLHYCLSPALELILSFSGGVIIGERGGSIRSKRTDCNLTLEETSQTKGELSLKSRRAVVPVLHARLGGHMRYPCGRRWTLVAVSGYQFSAYFEALESIDFYTIGSRGNHVCETVTFDGFYAGMGLLF